MAVRVSTHTNVTALAELEDATERYVRARKAERKRMAELQALVSYWGGNGVPETELASITGLTRTTVRRAVGKMPSGAPAEPPHERSEQDGDGTGAQAHDDVHG
jgi:hypothetical protein